MRRRGKYRWRTWLRRHLPRPLCWAFPKGRKDCGAHEWHRAHDLYDLCYHCEPGWRPRKTDVGPGRS
jgi:hypothetical protein